MSKSSKANLQTVLEPLGEVNSSKEIATKEPKLTVKQRNFLKAYLDPKSETFGNGTLSAMQVYDTDEYFSAGAIASENLKKLQNPIKTMMEARGIGVDKLLITLNNGLQAKKIHTSHTEPDREVPDHAVRHKYLETAGRWLKLESKGDDEGQGKVKRFITATEFFES